MRLGVLIQGREDDWEDSGDVVAHEIDNVLVVPVVERSLGNLEVLRVDASGELLEERNLDLLELDGLDDVENLLDLIEKHDLLRRVDLGPVPKETQKNLLGEHGILLEELDDTVGELGVVKS